MTDDEYEARADAMRAECHWDNERDALLEALADAVQAPKGVIPDSCLPYLAEIQRRTTPSFEDRLRASGLPDLRDNVRVVADGGGYTTLEPIDPSKVWGPDSAPLNPAF